MTWKFQFDLSQSFCFLNQLWEPGSFLKTWFWVDLSRGLTWIRTVLGCSVNVWPAEGTLLHWLNIHYCYFMAAKLWSPDLFVIVALPFLWLIKCSYFFRKDQYLQQHIVYIGYIRHYWIWLNWLICSAIYCVCVCVYIILLQNQFKAKYYFNKILRWIVIIIHLRNVNFLSVECSYTCL